MARSETLKFSFALTFALLSSFLVSFCSCIRVDSFNHSLAFASAIGTWFGPPNGVATGGACGYDADVARPPYSGFIAAGNPALFKNGKGCGNCYQVKCTQNPACSGSPVTVTIADSCPGCDGAVHFDLSGIAIGAMAKRGQADRLRNAGRINVLYQRVACRYRGTSIVFRVDRGSNRSFFATLIEYENGDGDLGNVELQPSNSKSWLRMDQSFGAVYKVNVPASAKAPFSIRLTQIESKRSIVARNVIPVNWQPGGIYRSNVNF